MNPLTSPPSDTFYLCLDHYLCSSQVVGPIVHYIRKKRVGKIFLCFFQSVSISLSCSRRDSTHTVHTERRSRKVNNGRGRKREEFEDEEEEGMGIKCEIQTSLKMGEWVARSLGAVPSIGGRKQARDASTPLSCYHVDAATSNILFLYSQHSAFSTLLRGP